MLAIVLAAICAPAALRASQADGQVVAPRGSFTCLPHTHQRPPAANSTRARATVSVYDYAGATSEIAFAESIAAEIFSGAGIDIVWGDACTPGLRPRIYVNLLTAAMGRYAPAPSTALGYAVFGTRTANILVDRVRATAISRRMPPAQLLGVVIAHELGHLLLPPNSHTSTGLMSSSMDLLRARLLAFRFTSEQAVEMARQLSADELVATR